jgi:translocation and assembly module TamB
VNGEIGLSRGSIEVFETGTLLRPLEVAITARGSEWQLTRLEARDGGSGTLTGSGALVLSEPLRLDARTDLAGFTMIRRDDVVSQLDGQISVGGAIGEEMLVAGRIENRETEVRLVNRLPPSVVRVDVTFTDEMAAHAETPASTPPPPADQGWIKLDLTVALPGRVFVRGRGLNSEWSGLLTIGGTAARPEVRGKLEPVRGDFDVLGRRFTLTRGRIGIDGLDQEITVDLTATYERSDLTAQVIVSGTAAAPVITLRSTPELPQDEILARVLFDKSTGNLGAAEAAQLAAAAAALASGEPGVLDNLRTAAGLDRLTLGSGSDTGGLGAVEAGKNIGEDVYVGVEQGLSATSSTAVVEVDITDNIKLRSSTSAEGSNRVGVRWQWDY